MSEEAEKLKEQVTILAPCCVIVKGYTHSCIYDLQRNGIYRFKNKYLALFRGEGMYGNVVVKAGNLSKNEYRFLDGLKKKELCIETYDSDFFCPIDTSEVYTERCCENAIVDRDLWSEYSMEKVSRTLSYLDCAAVCIRYYDKMTIDEIDLDVEKFEESTIVHLEIHFTPRYEISENDIREYKRKRGRVCAVYLYSQTESKVCVLGNNLVIVYTTEMLRDSSQCGYVSEKMMCAQTQFYVESKNYNNCLYRKLSIDVHGNIKNCPAMRDIFGSIYESEEEVKRIFLSETFSSIWNVRKDLVDTCRDCEYRYACQDCRCFRLTKDIYSKPRKCKYNPYEENSTL